MNISKLIWLFSVIGSTLILHFLIKRGTAFYRKKFVGENERIPGYIQTIRRTILMLIWLISIFLCSYAIFPEKVFDTITANLVLSVWIGSLVLVCLICNAISLNFFDRRIAEYSQAEEKDPTTYKFLRYVSSFSIFLFGGIVIAFSIPGLRSVAQSALASAGVLALLIGIASQEVLANIMGGTFIVIFKPFRVGDIVDINTVSGRVEDITLRHTVVNSFQNKRIVIPNAVINKEQIINYNMNERKVCEWIEFNISYDSNIDKALAIMQKEAMKHPYFL
jgi:small-conductance mechanosensitive channel